MMERENGVFDWLRTYSSPLKMNKLALVNFSHSQLKVKDAKNLILLQTTPKGTIRHELAAKPQAKLLGVLLNLRLNWMAQHEKVRGNTTKFTAAFKRYMKAASGIQPKEVLKLYNAIAVPRICYTSDVWYRPPHKSNTEVRKK